MTTVATTSGMTDQDIESTLSEAYVDAVAASAGANTSHSRRDYGIDGKFNEIMEIDGQFVECGSTIQYQLKASINCTLRERELTYYLKKDAYNRLVAVRNNSASPVLLLILRLPRDKNEWFSVSEDALQIRYCCYWLLWQEKIPTKKAAVPIKIPRTQIFSPDALLMLFEQDNRGRLLR